MPRRKQPKIPDAILDQLLAGADPKTAFDPSGLLDDLKKALAERALNAEMDHHLAGDGGVSNSRNLSWTMMRSTTSCKMICLSAKLASSRRPRIRS